MATGSKRVTDSVRRREGGTVWCSRRGCNAVVSLVGTGGAFGDYVQWCSLVGADLGCDESCLSAGAEWPGGRTPPPSRELFLEIQDVVELVERQAEVRGFPASPSWSDWARAFRAGMWSAPSSWQAARAARARAIGGTHGGEARRLALAAEDVAWAAAHAASGNVALALRSMASARRLATASSS